MELATIFIHFLNGLAIGGILILLALGLNIVFGLRGIVNAGHGIFYMLGAYISSSLSVYLNLNFFLIIIAAFLINIILGCIVEKIFIKPLVDWNREPVHIVIVTIGLAFICQELVKFIWGTSYKIAEVPSFLQGVINFGGIVYPIYWLFVIGFTATLTLILGIIFKKSGIGILVQSLVMNENTSKALGTNASLLNNFVFGFGVGCAGIAGVLSAPIGTITTEMCFDKLMLLFGIIIIGGLGSFAGVVVSGLIIGLVISFGTALLNGTMANMLVFIVMIAVIIVRPHGFFGNPGIMKL
jgi:branched-chain amino acid transport system permease protein